MTVTDAELWAWVDAQPSLNSPAEPSAPVDGWVGWVGILLVIVGWNGRCIRNHRSASQPHEMLSEFAARHRAVFVPAGLYLALHFGRPKWLNRLDPLHAAAELLCTTRQPKEIP